MSIEATKKIKNCFCGYPAKIEKDTMCFFRQEYSDRYPEPVASQPHGFKIRCVKCGIQTCFWHYESEAIEAWNKPKRGR